MNTGVIGAGMISEIYLKNMIEKFDNLKVLAIADLNMDHAKKRAEQFGIQACTVEEMLSDSGIEMIVNLTSVGAHYMVIKQALNAGKHVYTEKTITQNSEQAKELMTLAEEKGLYLGAAPDTFLGSALQAAKMALNDQLLGTIHSFAISANRNNEILLSLIPYLRQPGVGVMLDYGVYYMTALVSLLGAVAKVGGIVGSPYKHYRNVIPDSPEFGQMVENPNESQISAVLQLENGITGTFHIDTDSILLDEAFFAIYGTKGVLYLSDPNQFGGVVKFQPNSMDPANPTEAVTLWQFTPYGENDRGIGPAEMAEAIEHQRIQRTTKEMSNHVLEVLEAILKCGEKGAFADITSTCEIPPAMEQKHVQIDNIGHITFQMKNEEEMVRFYSEILGMKRLFTLTVRDLADSLKEQHGEGILESLQPLLNAGVEIPWIQYLKLSDHQYLELFHNLGNSYGELENREAYYGFRKVNYEVDDIEVMHKRIVDAGVSIKEEIHPTADGSIEFAVLDPDGNEIQFTQYRANGAVPLTEELERESFSAVKYTTQVAFQIQDEINMMNFYCKGLGLKRVFTLTYGMLAQWMAKSGMADEQTLAGLNMMASMPCIDYIEVAPHQYIEFFYCTGQTKKQQKDLTQMYGYQHICLEVPDIQAAWDAVVYNGIQPDTQIALGAEGSYQFWITDPDGNKLELMQYVPGAKQLLR